MDVEEMQAKLRPSECGTLFNVVYRIFCGRRGDLKRLKGVLLSGSL